MKAYLVYKDGRRVETPFEGAQRIHCPRQAGSQWFETIFEADADIVDGCIIYRETETKDITEQMKRAAERNRERTMAVFRRGLR